MNLSEDIYVIVIIFFLMVGILYFSSSWLVSAGILVDPCLCESVNYTCMEKHTSSTPGDWLSIDNIKQIDGAVIIYGNFTDETPGTVAGTGSMKPTLDEKSHIIYGAVGPDTEYSIGDIVVFTDDDSRVIHRIYNITEDGFVTKGDNNFVIDEYIVQREDIEAVVYAIVY